MYFFKKICRPIHSSKDVFLFRSLQQRDVALSSGTEIPTAGSSHKQVNTEFVVKWCNKDEFSRKLKAEVKISE